MICFKIDRIYMETMLSGKTTPLTSWDYNPSWSRFQYVYLVCFKFAGYCF